MNICIKDTKFKIRIENAMLAVCSMNLLSLSISILFYKKTMCTANSIDYFILFDVKKNPMKDSESENIIVCSSILVKQKNFIRA